MIAPTRLCSPTMRVACLRSNSLRGFTLLELLIVIVIIGVVISMVSLSFNVLGRDTQIEDQAKRLDKIIEQVRAESEMQGKDVGLFLERDGFLFMRFHLQTQTWQEITDDDMLNYRAIPPGLGNRLWLDGREVILKTHDENTELTRRQSESSSGNTSSSASSNSAPAKDARIPQVFILSSGDLTPFELRIEREGVDYSWHVVGKPDNSLIAEITDAPH